MNDNARYLLELSEKTAKAVVEREKKTRIMIEDLKYDLDQAVNDLNRELLLKNRIATRIKRLRATLGQDPESEKLDVELRVEHECGVECDYDCYLFDHITGVGWTDSGSERPDGGDGSDHCN